MARLRSLRGYPYISSRNNMLRLARSFRLVAGASFPFGIPARSSRAGSRSRRGSTGIRRSGGEICISRLLDSGFGAQDPHRSVLGDPRLIRGATYLFADLAKGNP